MLTGCEFELGGKKHSQEVVDYSYAIGTQIGKNFKSQKIEIDYKSLTKGIQDIVENQPVDSNKITQDLINIQNKINEKKDSKSN